MEKEKKITNCNQFNKLVEEMEANPSLAKGFQKGSVPCDFKEQWEKISNMLNALGPPRREGDGWQKVWRDLKFKVKKKLVTNKAECMSTGGGIFKQTVLSPLEEAVANLLQFQKQLNPEGAVQGVQSVEPQIDVPTDVAESSDLLLANEIELLASSTSYQNVETCTPSKRKEKSVTNKPGPCNDHYELLKKHSDEQAQILQEINKSISSLKRSLKDIIEIQKKRFKIELEENERKKEQHDAEMKIKRIKFLIKEKELQLLDKS